MKVLKSFVSANRRAARWLEQRFPSTFGAAEYKDEVKQRVEAAVSDRPAKVVIEVGGIDRPLLKRGAGFTYIGLDIEEKPACHEVYDRFIVQSVEQPIPARADVITSVTLLEHVRNNSAAIESIFAALNADGATHHYVPSKWHPYAIATRVVGPEMQRRLIRILRPDAMEVTGYPTFFNHCSPRAMSTLFKRSGFEEIELKVYYRATDYFAFFLPLYLAVAIFENIAAALRLRLFASGFVISARKLTG